MDWLAGDPNLIRAINLAKAAEELRTRGPLSRVELARRTGVSKTTMTGLMADLLQAGCVREVGTQTSARGRRPTLVEFKADWKHVMAVRIDADGLQLGLVDLQYRVVAHTQLANQQPTIDDTTLTRLQNAMAGLCTGAGLHWPEDVLGIGVLLPGVVNPVTGVTRSRLQNFSDYPIKTKLEQLCDKWVVVDNDANGFAVAERLSSALQRPDNLVGIVVGEGVGAGIVMNGQLLRGAHMAAGQIAHLAVGSSGRRCRCGQLGCLETEVIAPRLLDRFAEMSGEKPPRPIGSGNAYRSELTLEELGQLARNGHPAAVAVFRDAGRALGNALAFVVGIVNPAEVVLGGTVVEAGGSILLDALRQTLEAATPASFRFPVTIRASRLGVQAWLVGAAALVLEEAFRPPVFSRSDPWFVSFPDLVLRAQAPPEAPSAHSRDAAGQPVPIDR